MTPFFKYRRISTPEGRRKALVDYIILFLGLLVVAGLITVLFVEPCHPGHSLYPLLLSVTLGALAIAFLLNRTDHTTTANWLVSATAVLAPWWAILHDPAILGGDSFPLAYLTLTVLLCGMLLPSIAAVLAAAVNLCGLIAVRSLVPSVADYNWPSIFLFLLTTTFVYMVYHSLSRADLRQTRELLDLLREDEKKIRDLSFRDALTGAWNRRFMDETLPHVCALATRDRRSISFIMADLDRFKSINDRFGHPVGDLVLAGVARAILDCVRESDLVFRYGGDEFLVVLPDSPRAHPALHRPHPGSRPRLPTPSRDGRRTFRPPHLRARRPLRRYRRPAHPRPRSRPGDVPHQGSEITCLCPPRLRLSGIRAMVEPMYRGTIT